MDQRLAQVWGAIDPQRLRRTLMEMVDIYSPSGKEEDIQLYLEERLAAAGIPVRRQVVEEERYNLVATMGGGEPSLYLVGHVDTVAAWDIEEYAAVEEWGVVRGLGSADMKGGCAAMVEAAASPAAVGKCPAVQTGTLAAGLLDSRSEFVAGRLRGAGRILKGQKKRFTSTAFGKLASVILFVSCQGLPPLLLPPSPPK